LEKEIERLDDEFTRLAGVGEYLDPAIISCDFNSLNKLSNEKAEKLIEFADRYIAHHDKRQHKKGDRLPTYSNLNSLIDVLVNLFVKYSRLVTGGGVSLIDDIQQRNLEREIELIFDP
jgi:hypothetical protein